VFYWMLKVILSPFLRTFWRPWVEGLENVPAEGPAILAGNHLSFLDSIFLPYLLPRRVTFLAKIDYFTGRGLKGRAKRMFFSGVGQLPIDRSGGKASDAALRSGVRVLDQGKLLGIYPEGTRSPDGRLYRGKIGVARMALEAKVLVIPVAMIGTFEVQPQGRTIPRVRRVGMRIGRPLDFSRYADMAEDRFVLRSITDEIMYELMQLSGQEYVDMYAQKAKDELTAARAAAAEAAGAAGGAAGDAAAPGAPQPAMPAKPTTPADPAASARPTTPSKPATSANPATPTRPQRRRRPGRATLAATFTRPAAPAAPIDEPATSAPTATTRAGVPGAERVTDIPAPQRRPASGVPADLPPDPLQR